ncbi:uncharacterized protein LOC126764858 isoform X5 [Bactrocera neohumeralis]|uniref:uncharacterized protein LOC126764858 isoform X4 n=1 Tax=Bactrocera neohumeralis TaxID=98809 RepID=UPI00216550B3|nr:uncharacterized protein LOC126764858 isoform X4 [Bactrocera neohumeralis]XP_050338441.1 uncharacterized protein LOC126764858 isoform X5 [Bactrocera neohumeralis]
MGVLKFLLDHTKNEDAKGTTCQEMGVEKKQFLESALNTMTTDVMKEFQNAISILDDQESAVTDKVNALHIIRESIDDIDFANSFVKAGGSVYLIQNLNHTDCEIISLAAYIIAEMSQNNPVCQKHFVDANTIPALMRCLNQSDEVATSSLHAISSLLQNFGPGLVEFVNVDGIQILLTCLDVNNAKMFVRVCFLIGKLAERQDLRDELVEKSAIIRLIKCLPVSFNEYNSRLEALLYALSELSKSNKWMIEESQGEKLKKLATSVVENIKSVEEYEAGFLNYMKISLSLRKVQGCWTNLKCDIKTNYSGKCKPVARKNSYPPVVHQIQHSYFLDYENLPKRCLSIQPGKQCNTVGDPTVNMNRDLVFDTTGSIYYKACFKNEYQFLPQRTVKNFDIQQPNPSQPQRLTITKKKWQHLQDLKALIPADCLYFYDNMPFE